MKKLMVLFAVLAKDEAILAACLLTQRILQTTQFTSSHLVPKGDHDAAVRTHTANVNFFSDA
jgi:hypothetical protein